MSALGLVPILIVIIGRLWTTRYFDYVGLPSSGLEFDVYDYAFRSREVLIGLVLGAVGFSAAWLYRGWLGKRGTTFLLLELLTIGLLVAWAFVWVDRLLSQSSHTSTGVLGLSMGLPLAAMVWFTVDVWQGPGDVKWPPDRFRLRRGRAGTRHTSGSTAGDPSTTFFGVPHKIAGLIANLLRKTSGIRWNAAPPSVAHRSVAKRLAATLFGVLRKIADLPRKTTGTLLYLLLHAPWLRQWRGSPGVVVLVIWRILAVIALTAIGSFYLPRVSERLAEVEAAADVATGKFAPAILEAEGDLPPEIASSADPTKSRPLRVILSQSQNTYVLHSTTCMTVGGFEPLQASVAVSGAADASALEEAVEVCKVFTIPTVRLKSIEYFQLDTKEPASESVARPAEVGLGDEPSQELFSSEDASDEEELACRTEEKKVHFYNSVWYEFTPPTDGTVLMRVQAAGFRPVVGVWEAPQEETTVVENVSGSGKNPRVACETRTVDAGPDSELVGVIANVRAGTRYLASVGAQRDGGGAGSVTFEFIAGGAFLSPAILEEALPEAELPSTPGRAQLELREFDTSTYELRAWSGSPTGFFLVSQEGDTVPEEDEIVALALVEVEEDRTILGLDREKPLDPGTWTLRVPGGFVGHVRLTVTGQPGVVLALAEDSIVDVQVREAMLEAIDVTTIRETLGLESPVVLDEASFGPRALTIRPDAEDAVTPRELLEEAGVTDGLAVQIQVEEEREEEQATLLAVAEILRQQLLAIGLDVTIAPCTETDICMRVFFTTEGNASEGL